MYFAFRIFHDSILGAFKNMFQERWEMLSKKSYKKENMEQRL